MKTKEEIEQLGKQSAQKKYRLQHITLEQIDEYGGEIKDHVTIFIQGYSQCQKDMDDKKYTEKQLLDAMSFAECYIIEHDKPLFLKSDGKPVPDCLEYINSLNKKN